LDEPANSYYKQRESIMRREVEIRSLTAAVAIGGFLGLALFAPAWLWALFIALVIGIASWEWGRLFRLSAIEAIGYAAITVVLLAILWRSTGIATGTTLPYAAAAVLLPALFFWIAIAPVVVQFTIPVTSSWVGLALGWVVLLAAGLAALAMREVSLGHFLAAVALVWVADSAAFFIGRRFGGNRLAERVSPGKTWAGFWGALGAVAAYALILYPIIGRPGSLLGWVVALLGVAVVAVVGDLFESWVKRQAGVKESGWLLPGHGGVLDRIDALIAVLPLMALWWLGW
jgi:phosphatidate cytidylyltransferase